MSRRPTRRRPPVLHGPLARYGFAAITLLAILTGQLYPALVTGALTALAWKAHP